MGDDDLRDGRAQGDHETNYPPDVWGRAWREAAYAAVVAIGCTTAVILMLGPGSPSVCWGATTSIVGPSGAVTHYSSCAALTFLGTGGQVSNRWVWLALFFGGMAGSNVFATKWLYHSWATQWWHRDRSFWRYLVPIQGGVLALFIGLMMEAQLVPMLGPIAITSVGKAAGIGFGIGLLADNVITAGSHAVRIVLKQVTQAIGRAVGYKDEVRLGRPEALIQNDSAPATIPDKEK